MELRDAEFTKNHNYITMNMGIIYLNITETWYQEKVFEGTLVFVLKSKIDWQTRNNKS